MYVCASVKNLDKYCRRGSRVFSKGGGEEENFERKMFFYTRIKHVPIKTRQICNSFSLLLFQEDCLLFFALCYYSLLFLKFETEGGATPVNPSRSANSIVAYRLSVRMDLPLENGPGLIFYPARKWAFMIEFSPLKRLSPIWKTHPSKDFPL